MKARRGLPLTAEDQRLLANEFYWQELPGGVFVTVPPPDITPAERECLLEEYARAIEAERRDDPRWASELPAA